MSTIRTTYYCDFKRGHEGPCSEGIKLYCSMHRAEFFNSDVCGKVTRVEDREAPKLPPWVNTSIPPWTITRVPMNKKLEMGPVIPRPMSRPVGKMLFMTFDRGALDGKDSRTETSTERP